MPTLEYKANEVPTYEALVGQPFDLKSPYRSTVPLLAYWSDAAARLRAFGDAIRVRIPGDATLTFEFTVSPSMGNGKASHTDLMVQCPLAAIAIEAKYTEGPYPTVADWLGDLPTENKNRF